MFSNCTEEEKKTIVETMLKPRWIINRTGELGIRVCGINMWYYKHDIPMIAECSDDFGEWRVIEKREFGEVILSEEKREIGE